MLLLAGKPSNSGLAVALDLIRAKRLQQHLAHLVAELLAGRDHRAQVFNMLARVWILHHSGHGHLAQRSCALVARVHGVLNEIEPAADEQVHVGPPLASMTESGAYAYRTKFR